MKLPSDRNNGSACVLVGALVALCAIFGVFGSMAMGQADVPSESVFVDVSWSGWNVRLVANGWLGFVAPEPRDDLKHITIAAADAVGLIDGLVAIGGLHLPERYPSTEESISLNSDGRLDIMLRSTVDGAETKIRLHVVDRDITVRWSDPSQVVPRELRDWIARFEALAEAKLIAAR